MAQQRKIGDSDKSISAVEWLQIKMATSSPQEMVENINVWFKEAKQMEKEQLNIARLDGINLANKGYGKE